MVNGQPHRLLTRRDRKGGRPGRERVRAHAVSIPVHNYTVSAAFMRPRRNQAQLARFYTLDPAPTHGKQRNSPGNRYRHVLACGAAAHQGRAAWGGGASSQNHPAPVRLVGSQATSCNGMAWTCMDQHGPGKTRHWHGTDD